MQIKVLFEIIIDEANDTTTFQVTSDGVRFATLDLVREDDDLNDLFYDVQISRNACLQLGLNVVQASSALMQAYAEFDKRDSWSDFEIDLDV
ncbi:hypothetical protein [Dyella telluris]|uniref:Uncharacterized protein n=1 Tax=Dyella telluris TaxID=2763498 RepID=A0A7G8Q4I3_9GAMM|nr:hypothetical protein [Dyella telluris]QNK01691.1 hypothetical protein H8F01_00480 [Dyella telluris]